MSDDRALRDHLVRLLDARQAHIDVLTALEKISFADLGAKPEEAPYTLWELFEHMRIAQWDILEFIRSAEHQSPEFPRGYWPESEAPPDEAAFERSRETFRRDLQAMKELVSDPETDLFATIPHGSGQTILREAMLVADHNAYHLGQLVFLMKMMKRW